MTDQKKFKERVRARMERTGESYAAARRHIDIEAKGSQKPESTAPSTTESGSDRRRAFREASLDVWRALTTGLAPDGGATTWTRPAQIVDVLQQIAVRAPHNHALFPDGGGLDLTGASLGREPNTIELDFQGMPTIIRPDSLTLKRHENDPLGEWAFFRLEAGELAPSGMYEVRDPRFPYERLVEIAAGEYLDGDLWDNPAVDENGGAVPLPPGARIVRRCFGGAFLIVPKGSGYNASPRTYGGQHACVSAFEFDAEIAKLIARLHEGKLYGIDLRG